MNLKNNKGYVITDVSISIIILLILVPVIMAMVYKVNTIKRATESKAEAINILVNTLEVAKGIGVTDLEEAKKANKQIFEKLDEDIYQEENNNGKISFEGEEPESATIESDKGNYLLSVEVIDFASSNNALFDVQSDIVKTVKANVQYRVNGEPKELNLSTVIK